MKVVRIGYSHSFQVSQFLFDKIYFEAELEPNDEENSVVQQLIEKCKEVERIVVQGMTGSLMSEPPSYESPTVWKQQDKFTIESKTEPKEQRIGVLVKDIESCTDLKILETYRFIKDTNEELKAAYQKRYNELTN
jgi:hypothetical protein